MYTTSPNTADHSLSNQVNRTHHHTSTSLTMEKQLTAWIGEPNGTIFIWSGRRDSHHHMKLLRQTEVHSG